MEMWRPRLRCTLQHSSQTSTPLLIDAQPGSGEQSRSQLKPREGTTSQAPTLAWRMLSASGTFTQSPQEPRGPLELFWKSLNLWEYTVPRAPQWVPCPIPQPPIPVSESLLGKQDCCPAIPEGGRSLLWDMTLIPCITVLGLFLLDPT